MMISERLVLFQLCFNIVMFMALGVLAWKVFRMAGEGAADAGRQDKQRGAKKKSAGASPAPPALPPALEDLVASAEQRELAAEAELRSRLSKYQDRSIG